jgi:hypothetical protein
MKKITMIFTALAFVIGFAVISCTKESTALDPTVSNLADAVTLDNTVADITGTVNDYQAMNPTVFVDPTTGLALKAASADPLPIAGMGVDKCATVTYVKTPTLTGTVVTGATIKFTIDFGTTGCVGKDGKARRGTLISTYTWVKEGGWSITTTFDLFISDIEHKGYVTSTYGVTGVNKHAYITDATAIVVTLKDGTTRSWNSNRQRELMEGNGGIAAVKIWKVTGSSAFTNVKGEKSTFTIGDALYKKADCKGFSAGSTTAVDAAGVKTTINYGPFTTYAALTGPAGFTVTAPGTSVRGAINTFIKWGI